MLSGNQLTNVTNNIDMVLLYFLTIFSTYFNVIVNHIIRSPGHGKDMVDCINSCDKRYLMMNMLIIDTQR